MAMKETTTTMPIPYNKPFIIGNELEYIRQAVESGKISGDGDFTKKCHKFFEDHFGFNKVLLTTSCTDALEMAALLCNIQPGDEVIVPSYTFVSTANAFVLRGANIIFADSGSSNPNISIEQIKKLITNKTKVIVPVHYAGISCDMDEIIQLAHNKGILVVEDAAQAIDSFYKGKPLGSIGDLATFSFHETKNIISGEGGMLVLNNQTFVARAEIIREKGTNRSAFFRGEIDKYGWVDVGSSFLPSEIISAFLYAQLENMEIIQSKRKSLWSLYYDKLKPLEMAGFISLPFVPDYATQNGHIFYIICRDLQQRNELIKVLKDNNVMAVFHYQSLHKSYYYKLKHSNEELVNADRYTDCLLRLPLYYGLEEYEVAKIVSIICEHCYSITKMKLKDTI